MLVRQISSRQVVRQLSLRLPTVKIANARFYGVSRRMIRPSVSSINGFKLLASSSSSQFARFLSSEMKESIQQAVDSAPVVLFMKGTPEAPACGFSRATINLLGTLGVDPDKFAAYNVLEDDELRNGIKEFSDWPTIPQLYVNGEFIGGCDIVTSMAQSGELLEMFEKDGLLVYEEEEAVVEEPSSSDVKPAKRG